MFPTISSYTVSHYTLYSRIPLRMLFSQAGSTQSLALYYTLSFLPNVWIRFFLFVVSFPLSLYHCALQDFTFYYGFLPRRHFSMVFFGIVALAMTTIIRAIVKVKIKVSFPISCSWHLQSFLPSYIGHLHPKWILSTQGSVMKELDVKLVAHGCTL